MPAEADGEVGEKVGDEEGVDSNKEEGGNVVEPAKGRIVSIIAPLASRMSV